MAKRGFLKHARVTARVIGTFALGLGYKANLLHLKPESTISNMLRERTVAKYPIR